MRITFIGTSHGVPEPNRRCSSTLIEVGSRRYIVDMGTEAIAQLITRGIPVTDIKGIFVTHMHGDHTNGLVSFVDLCSWHFKKADPAIFLPEPLDATVDALSAWLKCNGVPLRPFRFLPVREGLIYEDEVLRMTAFQTKHIDRSYAFLLEAEGKRVLFTGDLCHQGPQEDFPVSVLDEPLELAICESAHFPATAYLPVFAGRTNLKQLCFTHYTEKNLPSILEMKKALPEVNVFRVQDGRELII